MVMTIHTWLHSVTAIYIWSRAAESDRRSWVRQKCSRSAAGLVYALMLLSLRPRGAGSGAGFVSVAMLAVLSIAGGILIKYPSDFVQVAVKQMMGI